MSKKITREQQLKRDKKILIKKAEFIKSAVFEKDYPKSIGTEFAFVGKSNVGKSSLINSLTNNRKLAKTSKTPGRTRLLNFFLINDKIQFVDLPGYGFAKVSDSEREKWKKIIEDYLKSNREKVVLLLLDIRRIPSQEDIDMLRWLEYYNIRYEIIFTKCDKLSNNQRFKQLKKIKKKLVFNKEDVFFYSSLSKKGRYELSNYILKYK